MNIIALSAIALLLLSAPRTAMHTTNGASQSISQEKITELYKAVVATPESSDALHREFPNTFATVRQACADDVQSLSIALQHSMPSQLDKSGKNGISVYFLATNKVLGTLGDWELSENGKPAVFVEPDATEQRTLEEVLMHELAHNSEYRMGYDPKSPGSWKTARQLGWLWVFNPRTGDNGWIIRTTESERWFYSYDDTRGTWFRCDKNLQPLDGAGRVARNRSVAVHASNHHVQAVAVVTPPTDYFTNPMEMFAEAIRLFRTGTATRRQLCASHPQLYSLVRDHDQREIDKAFGRNSYIRCAGGVLVQATPQTIAEVQSFEADSTRVASNGGSYR